MCIRDRSKVPHTQAFVICSDWKFFHEEIAFLRKFSSFSLHPSNLFDKLVYSFLDNIYRPKTTAFDVPKLPVYARLPCIGPLSKDLHFQIRNILNKNFPQCKFLISCLLYTSDAADERSSV